MKPEPTGDQVPTMECRVCEIDVPAGVFCGLCGTHLTPHRGDGPTWLRPRVYGAAPQERVLLPAPVSSLFPQLPSRSRTPFRIGLIVLVLALVLFTFLQMPAALIAVGALGLPLLFLLYLYESDAFRDLPARFLLGATALGIALGVGWAMLAATKVAHSYGIPLGSGIAGPRILRDGLGIPLGGMLVMLIPVLVARLLRPPTRESLDGFMIGALGSLAFSAAATLTRLAPQFATGMVTLDQPMRGLMVEAGIRGVTTPLTAAAVGGLVGATLWFTRPPSKAGQHTGYVRLVMVAGAAVVVAMYAGTGLIDVVRAPELLQLIVHIAVALVALLTLRVGLQLAMLHEAHDPIASDEPLLCPQCGHVVPDMAFCPACGAATRASSRESRALRRRHRPVLRTDPGPENR